MTSRDLKATRAKTQEARSALEVVQTKLQEAKSALVGERYVALKRVRRHGTIQRDPRLSIGVVEVGASIIPI